MEEKQVLNRLQRLCARAEYCTGDVRRKALAALEGDAEAADRVVAALCAQRYVDDRRYAAAYVREKSALQGWGPVKIRFQLRGKGVDDAAIAAAFAELEPDRAAARLRRLAAEKARQLSGTPVEVRLKLLKYLMGRGYAYETAEQVAEQVLSASASGEGLPDGV